jgi:hypothetical protein
MYLSGADGDLVYVRQRDGKMGFAYSFKESNVLPTCARRQKRVHGNWGWIANLQSHLKDVSAPQIAPASPRLLVSRGPAGFGIDSECAVVPIGQTQTGGVQ